MHTLLGGKDLICIHTHWFPPSVSGVVQVVMHKIRNYYHVHICHSISLI